MDFEAPMDAWIVYIGVAFVSSTMLVFALGLTGTPAPNANAAANTIDLVGDRSVSATAEYEHDGDSFWIDRQQIVLRNDGGTSRATIAFGEITPAYYDERLADVTYGSPITGDNTFDSTGEFLATVEAAQQHSANNRPDWQSANGVVRAKKVIVGGEHVILVDV